MRKYELGLVVKPDLTDEARVALIAKFQGIIEAQKGSIVKFDDWGKRKLAYEIMKYREGFYSFTTFEGNEDAVNELNRIARISEELLRHLIIRVED